MKTPTGWRVLYAHAHTHGYLCNYVVIAYKITPAHTRETHHNNTNIMFTEAFLDIQEILDRNCQIEKEWRDFFFQPSCAQATFAKGNQK